MSTPASAQIAALALSDLVNALEAAEAPVRADEPDSVHAMRTLIRRLRSVLAAYSSAFDETVSGDIRARLKLLGAILGEARDLEVRANTAAKALAELPPEFGGDDARARLVDDVEREHDAARARVRVYLESRSYARLRQQLEEFVRSPPSAQPGSGAAKSTQHIVIAQAKRVRRRWKTARDADDFPQRLSDLHDVRKAAKRLRYTAEAIDATGVIDAPLAELAAAAEAVQDALGDHRDHLLYAEHLLFETNRAHAQGERTFAYGVIHERSAVRAQAALERVQPAVHELKRVTKTLGRAEW